MDFIPTARLTPNTAGSSRRRRVLDALGSALDAPGVVVLAAPAGSGKTTAAAQLIEEVDAHVVWYRLGTSDAEPRMLLRHLLVALAASLDLDGPDVDDPVNSILELLETVPSPRVVIVLDEVEAIAGADGLDALDELFEDLPDSTSIVLTTRSVPDVNLSLLSVRGRCTILKPDLLRFRTWEIDELFQRVYGVQLSPHELAELERRTGGWAAGLQLFHLATRQGSDELRRQTLDAMGGRRGPSWEFLARNVVDALSSELRDFLLDVVGMRRLRAPLCDELRDRDDSADLLDALAAEQLFVTRAVDGDGHLVHEVLGAHLRGRIVHEAGEQRLADLHRRAAELLDAHGYPTEAIEAYVRAGRWADAQRALREVDGSVGASGLAWVIDEAPDRVARDPWWTLASARRHRGEGRLASAMAAYEQVERNELSDPAKQAARRERLQLTGFSRPRTPTAEPWIAALRDGLAGEPLPAVSVESPALDAVAAINGLLASEPNAGEALLRCDRNGVPAGLRLTCVSLGALDLWLDGGDTRAPLLRLEDLLDREPEPWLVRFGAAVIGLVAGDIGAIDTVVAAAASNRDDLGTSVGTALRALAQARAEVTVSPVSCASHPAIDRWIARQLAAPSGPAPSPTAASRFDEPRSAESAPVARVHGFGGLRLSIAGEDVDLSALRPRARDVLRLLVASGGELVHEEVIADELWAGDWETTRPRLQTAVSSARGLVAGELGELAAIVRDEHGYRIEVDAEAEFDVRDFDDAASDGLTLSDLDPVRAADRLDTALRLSQPELMPESGAADWVVDARRRIGRRRVRVATRLAGLLADDGDLRGAAEVCERGLETEPYDPGLWSTLLELTKTSGDDTWHTFVAARHASVLEDLAT